MESKMIKLTSEEVQLLIAVLETSEPKMKHYAEPVARHESALAMLRAKVEHEWDSFIEED